MNLTDALVWMLTAAACVLASRRLLHYYQLESYQFRGYFSCLRRNRRKAWRTGLLLMALSLLLWGGCALLAGDTPLIRLACAALLCGAGFVLLRRLSREKEKRAFAVTARIRRLYAAEAAALLLALWLLSLTGLDATLLRVFCPALLPLWVALGALLALPVEKLIQGLYLQDAKRMLKARPDLIKIGITGSYGKTSVKFILGVLLREKYQVLVPPASKNTPMGLTKVIREELKPSHQILIAEMGARHPKDIRELCRMIHPDHGILTAVGPQHLETFGSIERIRETKYDLIRAIPPEGAKIFPDDGAICLSLYERTAGAKTLVSLRADSGADVRAEDIRVSPEGSAFTLCAGGERIACTTRLLGAHNIQNILLAAAMGLQLNMSLRQIARGIGKLQPVEHRLQLLPQAGGITIIDDAFNSNPVSANAALDVLKGFEGRRIIVTPGLVELGAKEADYNRAFGRHMAACVDLAILEGEKRSEPIREGLLEAGFPAEQIRVVRNLDEAAALVRSLAAAGDAILYENDLPDQY